MATEQELQVLANLVSATLNGDAEVSLPAGTDEVGALPVLEILKWVRDNKDLLLNVFNTLKDLWSQFQKPAEGQVGAFSPALILLAIQTLLPLVKEALPKIKELIDKFRKPTDGEAFPQV